MEIHISAGLFLGIFVLAIVASLVFGMIIGVIVGCNLRPQISIEPEPTSAAFVTPARNAYPDDPVQAPSPMMMAMSYVDALGNTRYRFEEDSGSESSGSGFGDVFAPLASAPHPPPRPKPARTADILSNARTADILSNVRSADILSHHRNQRPLPNCLEPSFISHHHNHRPLPSCLDDENRDQRPLPNCVKDGLKDDVQGVIRLRRNAPMILKQPKARVIGRSRLGNEIKFDEDGESDSSSESSCGPESPTEKHSLRRR